MNRVRQLQSSLTSGRSKLTEQPSQHQDAIRVPSLSEELINYLISLAQPIDFCGAEPPSHDVVLVRRGQEQLINRVIGHYALQEGKK
jgi:hypothetical protein